MMGLTSEEARKRAEAGQININENTNTRTYKEIILENTLTFFNFLNIILFVFVIIVGSYKNALFVMIIIINTAIGVFQEVRAKKTLDALAILTVSKARVIRDGKQGSIPMDQLVLGDTILLKSGDQIPADARVLSGGLEVNESLLTGEADILVKWEGAELYSGSFVTAGQAYCEVIHVGADNYSAKITSEAKEFKKHNSELRNSLNKILKVISIIIVPMGIGLFYKQYFVSADTFANAVVSTVAALLGMIPEGLVLLTSVALTLGSMKLAKQRVLVQELYCIETLAHVDTLCLDKTGTITSGSMCVDEVVNLGALDVNHAMANILSTQTDGNDTSKALEKHFHTQRDWTLEHAIPFSSDRKYSGAVFVNEGTYLMGAIQFLFPMGYEDVKKQCQDYAANGYRVLVLAHSDNSSTATEIPGGLKPCALILITDVIRKEAPETLMFFDKQGVDLKVISGDDPITVSAIAKKAGLKNADKFVDATTIRDEADMAEAVANNAVFGRVTPQQKKEMVQILKQEGHTVAMTGDGVNDVLALKEANCSIAMASGSDAAKNIANLVLLDSNFGAMPHIVNQGRRVVNNIRKAASMFLIKTIFSVFLSLLLIFFGDSYPFEPIQMSLISMCAVGIPTFLLAQESDFSKIDHTFLRHVFMKAVPTAITITVCVFTIMQVCIHVYHDNSMLSTACVLVTGWGYMAALRSVYSPPNLYRKIVTYGMNFIFFIGALLFQKLLMLDSLEFGMIILVFALMTISPVLIDFFSNALIHAAEYFAGVKRRRDIIG